MPAIKFSRALYDFESYLDAEKNLAPRTRRAYVYDLDRFMDYWIGRRRENPTLDKITTADIKQYLEHLRNDKDYKSATLSRTIASIRIFFEFCVLQGFLETSPAEHLHNPKSAKKLPIFLIEQELKRLFDAPKEEDANATHERNASKRPDYKILKKRDYAILVTLAFTGLRLSELVGLNIRDITFSRQNLRVMGKGSKERIVPLNQIVIDALNEWMEVRPSTEDREAVFLNRFGRRISARGVEKIVEKYVQSSGIGKDKVSPHKLRHTFATLLHLSGVDILEIQALLGHSSITSTQIYTHANTQKLQNAVNKLESLE